METATFEPLSEAERKITARTIGEPLFQGQLPQERFDLARLFSSRWKLRFVKLYFDHVDYGKWSREGKFILAHSSPIVFGSQFEVSVSAEDYGADGTTPRTITMRTRGSDAAPWLVIGVVPMVESGGGFWRWWLCLRVCEFGGGGENVEHFLVFRRTFKIRLGLRSK